MSICKLLSPPPHPPKKCLADSRQMRLRGRPSFRRTPAEPSTFEYAMMKEGDHRWEREGEPAVYAIGSAAEIDEEPAEDMGRVLEDRHYDMEVAQMGALASPAVRSSNAHSGRECRKKRPPWSRCSPTATRREWSSPDERPRRTLRLKSVAHVPGKPFDVGTTTATAGSPARKRAAMALPRSAAATRRTPSCMTGTATGSFASRLQAPISASSSFSAHSLQLGFIRQTSTRLTSSDSITASM